ncbi:MAG: hypothetical protein QF664_12825 [Dehalococcoidia bacterium]|jgi:hypothetical protein|nr:hypothetical protein [Dehalococcoidia bacterium]
MDVDFAFLSDAAQESGGKLHAIGIGVDGMVATEVPAARPLLAVVVQVRYSVAEIGQKELAIRVVDADGGNVIPPIDSLAEFGEPQPGMSGVARYVIELAGLAFPHYGDYAIHVAISGHEVANLPMAVREPA